MGRPVAPPRRTVIDLSRTGATRPQNTAAGASVCRSVAILIRPQFLALWSAFSVVHGGAPPRNCLGRRHRAVAAPGTRPTLGRRRPSGANDTYFVQEIHLAGSGETHCNLTRVETEVLFTRGTGRSASNIDDLNTHSVAQAPHPHLADPRDMKRLVARKA